MFLAAATSVLPLLQSAVVTPNWVDASDFLAGYGAAQAVPGPPVSPLPPSLERSRR
ncbi:chromate transporter [Cupriavidus basilensis]